MCILFCYVFTQHQDRLKDVAKTYSKHFRNIKFHHKLPYIPFYNDYLTQPDVPIVVL